MGLFSKKGSGRSDKSGGNRGSNSALDKWKANKSTSNASSWNAQKPAAPSAAAGNDQYGSAMAKVKERQAEQAAKKAVKQAKNAVIAAAQKKQQGEWELQRRKAEEAAAYARQQEEWARQQNQD